MACFSRAMQYERYASTASVNHTEGNQIETSTNKANAAFSPAEEALLSLLPVTAKQQILAVRQEKSQKSAAKTKVDIAGIVSENCLIFDLGSGQILWTARQTGELLNQHGLYHEVKGFHAVGNALGCEGLDLPWIGIPKRYDLSMVGASQESKAKRQEELNSAKPDVIDALTSKFGKADIAAKTHKTDQH